MPRNRYAESAKTLVLVSIILLAIFLIVSIFSNAAIRFILYLVLLPIPGTAPSAADISTLASIAVTIMWIVLNYFLIYKPISNGDYEGARNPSLALGILELLLGGFIPGILLLVAHGKLEDALTLEESKRKEGL